MFDKIRKTKEKDSEKLHQEQMARCVPVARKVLALLLAKLETIPMGDDDGNDKEINKLNDALAIDVLNLFLAEDIRWTERELILQLALQPISTLKEIVGNSTNFSWNTIISGLWGKTSNLLTFTDIDKALRKGDAVEAQVVEMT